MPISLVTSSRKAFTLIELLTVIAIIALLAAIIFPVFSKAREAARRASCTSNLKQLTAALFQYTDDYDGFIPGYLRGGAWLPAQKAPYVKSSTVWKCPSALSDADEFNGTNGDFSTSYGINLRMSGISVGVSPTLLTAVPKPVETIALIENRYNAAGAAVVEATWPNCGRPWPYHNEFVNTAFLDGHVKALPYNEVIKRGTDEDGVALTGHDQNLLWNLY